LYFLNFSFTFLICFYQGDLHEFLICHSPRSDVSACSDDGNVHVLEQPEFLHIALQIAAGNLNSFTVSYFSYGIQFYLCLHAYKHE